MALLLHPALSLLSPLPLPLVVATTLPFLLPPCADSSAPLRCLEGEVVSGTDKNPVGRWWYGIRESSIVAGRVAVCALSEE